VSTLLFVAILVLFCLGILVGEQWEELKRVEGEFKSEFRASLEKRFVHAAVVIACVGILVAVFGTSPFGLDPADVVLGAALGSISWPLSRVLEERIFGD